MKWRIQSFPERTPTPEGGAPTYYFESATGKKNDEPSFLEGACDKKQKSYLCPESPFIELTGSEDTNKFGLKDQMRSCTRSIDRFSLSLHELLVLRSMLFWKEQHMRSLNNTYNDSAHLVSKRMIHSFGQINLSLNSYLYWSEILLQNGCTYFLAKFNSKTKLKQIPSTFEGPFKLSRFEHYELHYHMNRVIYNRGKYRNNVKVHSKGTTATVSKMTSPLISWEVTDRNVKVSRSICYHRIRCLHQGKKITLSQALSSRVNRP